MPKIFVGSWEFLWVVEHFCGLLLLLTNFLVLGLVLQCLRDRPWRIRGGRGSCCNKGPRATTARDLRMAKGMRRRAARRARALPVTAAAATTAGQSARSRIVGQISRASRSTTGGTGSVSSIPRPGSLWFRVFSRGSASSAADFMFWRNLMKQREVAGDGCKDTMNAEERHHVMHWLSGLSQVIVLMVVG